VGGDRLDDVRRLSIARETMGPERILLLDANQVWDVDEAIEWMAQLRFADPYFIEEPTCPDDVEGHRRIREAIAPIRVATGEVCQNRVAFKQFLQRGAIDIVQLDACRLGGLNEVLAVLLLSAKFDRPVWPHAGGVGLCEYVQHIAAIDYLCVSGQMDGRVVEYVDHLHEHFVHPVVVSNAMYQLPTEPGFSIEMKQESLARFRFSG
jgi:L-fuconate dehydratase